MFVVWVQGCSVCVGGCIVHMSVNQDRRESQESPGSVLYVVYVPSLGLR